MSDKIYSLSVMPGIQRDGTTFSSRHYIDGQWCRFFKGLPKKMGGYKFIAYPRTEGPEQPNDIVRGMMMGDCNPRWSGADVNARTRVHYGYASELAFIDLDGEGRALNQGNIRLATSAGTHDVSLDPNKNYNWKFEIFYGHHVGTPNQKNIYLYVIPDKDLADIGDNDLGNVFYGRYDLPNNTFEAIKTDESIFSKPFTATGVVSLYPFLFFFGNGGEIYYAKSGVAPTHTRELTSAVITSSKVVAGFPVRGGNTIPSGIFWSLDSVIRVSYANNEFKFDTLTSESSILSSKGIAEFDNLFYWIAIDRFLCYNGAVQELPNNMSIDFFFKHLNYKQKQKVWATKVPRWGEIWWFFPKNTLNEFGVVIEEATECNHAIVYNVRENLWYDTQIDRSAGFYPQTFHYPVWASTIPNQPGFTQSQFPILMHEIGTEIQQDPNATRLRQTIIPSHFETADIAWCAFDAEQQRQGLDRNVELYRIEPDFNMVGTMSVEVRGRKYANSPVVGSAPKLFDNTTEKIDFREQRRQMTLRFSTVPGGEAHDYHMGQVLLIARIADGKP